MPYLKNLSADEYQLKAINHPDGPVCVLAGPGSGKTYILTHRIKYLIETGRYLPQEILVITFTRKAAEEMRSRFISMGVSHGSLVTFGTFHSVYYQFLKLFNDGHVPYILSNKEKAEILRNIFNSNINLKSLEAVFTEGIDTILSMISKRKSGSKESSVLEKDPAFIRLYNEYETAKESANKIDYDDILILCKKMFEEYPESVDLIKERIKYVLVDEFQDINPIQADILRKIVTDNNLFIVGDDDQSIYRFRGASYEIMSDFIKEFSLNVIGLKNNYRNPKCVLNPSESLIKENKGRLKTYDLISQSNIKGLFDVRLMPTKADELYEIKKIVNDNKNKDLCILVRTNKDLNFYESVFSKVSLSSDELKKEIYATLKHYVDFALYSQRKDMLFILRTPETYVSNSIFTDSYVDLEEMVKRAGSLSTKNSLNILNNHFKVLKKLPPFAFLNYVINIVGIKNNFYEKAASKTKAGVDGIFHELIDKSKGMKTLKELSDFLSLDDTVSLYRCKVKVLTFHASKGLEFDTGILPDVNEGRIPSRAFLSLDNNDEERRLFYVAMTRARENLHIFAVKKEGSASVLPSRFITGFLDKYHK